MGELDGVKEAVDWIKKTLDEQHITLKRIDQRLDDGAEKCRDRHTELDRDLTAIKVKAGFWGIIAGAIPGLLAAIALYFKR